MTDSPEHELAVTERCLKRDLDLEDMVEAPPDEQADAHQLLKAFYERRAKSSVGQETIEDLQANIVAYSLHAGRWRGLTWHDIDFAIVWLLAGRYHRSGQGDDSYPHFRGLSQDQLLPTEADYERVFDRDGEKFASAVQADIGGLLAAATTSPGKIVEQLVGGRVGTRALASPDGTYEVAVRLELHPGEEELPAEWLMIVLAVCFPETSFESLVWGRTLGDKQLPSNEWSFRPQQD